MARVKPSKVVYFSPEILDRARGEYREVTGEAEENGSFALTYGELVQWVDDAPDDRQDGAGHYETYDGDERAYTPTRSA